MNLYNLPSALISFVFLTLLLYLTLLIVIALRAKDNLEDLTKTKNTIRFYSSFLPLSLTLLIQAWFAISGVEAGTYINWPNWYNYSAFLPLLNSFHHLISQSQNRKADRYNFFLSLLPLSLYFFPFLPFKPATYLYFFLIFALVFDAIFTTLSLIYQKQRNLNYRAISELIYKLDVAICLLDKQGRVLEFNPAFTQFCQTLQLPNFKTIGQFHEILDQWQKQNRIKLETLKEARLIRTPEQTFLLRANSFTTGKKKYNEISINDVSSITKVADRLAEENLVQEEENLRLKNTLNQLAEESARLERERLRRFAHDTWSQRLAIAGFTLDNLLQNSVRTEKPLENLKELHTLLSLPAESSRENSHCLKTSLDELQNMYKKLGVSVEIQGQAEFTAKEQRALIPISKEALANAVRHAYALKINIECFTTSSKKGIIITNEGKSDMEKIKLGRGLLDVQRRAEEVGGVAEFSSGEIFQLKISFPLPADS